MILLLPVGLFWVLSQNSQTKAQTVTNTISLGTSVEDVAVNQTTNRIYVCHGSSKKSVSVIDGGTNAVVATVGVGDTPFGVAANSTTNRIYVTNRFSNTVSVIDGGTNTVIATVPVGNLPNGVGVNPTTNLIYVANEGSGGSPSDKVSVIDGGTNAVVATVNVAFFPRRVAVDPQNNRIYVTSPFSNALSVIDGGTNSVVATVSLDSLPRGVTANPNTNRIYVSHLRSDKVSVIDGGTNTVIATVTGKTIFDLEINPNTNRIYGTSGPFGGNIVTVIDGGTNTIISHIPVGQSPWGLAVNKATNLFYVGNQGGTVSVIEDVFAPFDFSILTSPSSLSIEQGSSSSIKVDLALSSGTPQDVVFDITFDPILQGLSASTPEPCTPTCSTTFSISAQPNAELKTTKVTIEATGGGTKKSVDLTVAVTLAVVGSINVGSIPQGVGVNPTPNTIYVANNSGNTVSVIRGSDNTVVATLPVGSGPQGVGVNPTTNRIYVSNFGSHNVSVIDGGTNSEITRIPVGANPYHVGVNPTTNRIYVANPNSNTVSVIDGDSNTVIATIGVGTSPLGVAVNITTNRIYVTNIDSKNVSVINGSDNTVITTINLPADPHFVGVNPLTNRIYVSEEPPNGNVLVIDGNTNNVVATVPVFAGNNEIGINTNTNHIFVASNFANKVFVIDGTVNDKVIGTIDSVGSPVGIGVNPQTNSIYVSDTNGNKLFVIQDIATFDFSVSPVHVGLPRATSHTFDDVVRLSLIVGPTQPVTFTAEGLPPGMTATFSPATCSPPCNSDLTLSSTLATPLGNYNVTIRGTGGGITRTSNIRVELVPEPLPFDYSLSASPTSLTVNKGSSAQTTVEFRAISGGGNVLLSVEGLPTGAEAGFKDATTGEVHYPNIWGPPRTLILTISTSLTTPDGIYNLIIKGIGTDSYPNLYPDPVIRTANLQLTVFPPADFSLTVLHGLAIQPGSSGTTSIAVTLLSGTATTPILLSASGLPEGATASFSPSSCTPTCTSTLTISASATMPTGTFNVEIRGIGSGATRTITLSFIVGPLIKVPIRWCGVEGSPSLSDMLQRHGRANTLYEPQIGLVFRSGLPPLRPQITISDPQPPPQGPGQLGDIFGTRDALGIEYQQALQNCRNAWLTQYPNVVGITAVHINRFVNSDGTPSNLWGLGGLSQFSNTNSQLIAGRIWVIDSSYVLNVYGTEIESVLVGHELGHALTLRHGDGIDKDNDGDLDECDGFDEVPPICGRDTGSEAMNLMQYAWQDKITGTQADRIRSQALLHIPDSSTSPPSSTSAALRIDALGDVTETFVDIDTIAFAVDSESTTFSLSTFGLFPDNVSNLNYFFFSDVDNNPSTGGSPSSIGFPSTAKGIDIIGQVQVNVTGGVSQATPTVMKFQDGSFVTINDPDIKARVIKDIIGLLPEPGALTPDEGEVPIAEIIMLEIPNEIVGPLPQEFSMQTIAQNPSTGTVDGADVCFDFSGEKKVCVQIDIKPGSDPNSVNAGSEGVIPVSILTTPAFDAATVDPFSVTLEGGTVKLKGQSGNAGSLEDVDGDGDLDLVIQITDWTLTEGQTTAVLTGKTKDGISIQGKDTIRVIPP